MLRIIKITRVWEIAQQAHVPSVAARDTIKSLGYPGVKSSSSRLEDLLPIEREALVATVAHAGYSL